MIYHMPLQIYTVVIYICRMSLAVFALKSTYFPLHIYHQKRQLDNYSLSTSKIASTSTATPKGSEFVPTAERAWTPLSPNALTNKSEQPLTTAGC